jgi:multidrug resistance protein MdtO
MMWLVFDQLWGSPPAVEMMRSFISSLRLLAQFVKEPLQRERGAIEHNDSLRENINAHFDTTRALADGVLFEFDASRQQDLALRNHIRQWQPKLRALFLIQIAVRKYSLQLPGFALPETIQVAQQECDDRLARMLEAVATRMENGALEESLSGKGSFGILRHAVGACCAKGSDQSLRVNVQTVLALSRTIENLATTVEKEIRSALL